MAAKLRAPQQATVGTKTRSAGRTSALVRIAKELAALET